VARLLLTPRSCCSRESSCLS